MNFSHELLTLIRSRYPVVGVQTWEERRLEKILGYLRRSAEDGLYFLKDLHHHLGDTGIQRALRSAAEAFRKDRRCIILAASAFEIPCDLEKEIMLVPLALPDIEEIKRTLYRTVSGLEGGSRIRIDMDRAQMSRFLEALRGLTLEEIEYTILEIVLEDRVLDVGDIPRVLERKKRSLMRDSALDFVPAGEGRGP